MSVMRVSETLRAQLGLTHRDLSDLWVASMGRCAICHDSNATLELDHDHALNRARGFLCHRCNMVLGLARDDTTILESATRYLRAQT